MKALTLHQPWASLIATGAKPIETRSRNLFLHDEDGQKLAIHAGKKSPIGLRDVVGEEWISQAAIFTGVLELGDLPRGAVIAIAKIEGCKRIEKVNGKNVWFEDGSTMPFDLWGDYTPGRYGIILRDVEPIVPVAARGYQGVWQWVSPYETVAERIKRNG